MERHFLSRLTSLLVAVLLGMTSIPLSAATELKPEQSWENLKQLTPGTKIQVEYMNRDMIKGVLIGVTDERLSFRTSKGEQSLDRAQVYQVKNREKNHHLRNGFIGMGIGAGALGIVAATGCTDRSNTCDSFAGAMAVFGAALGAVGFAFGNHQTVYKADRRTKSK